jgi:hypothetical protein
MGWRMTGVKEMKEDQAAARHEQQTKTILGFVPYIGWLAYLVSGRA